MSSSTPVGAPGAHHVPHEVSGLEVGHLSRPQLVSLSLASFIPAVGMALVPMLMFTYAGMTSWPAQLIAAAATICLGLAVISFARRYVATGSLYSYIGEVFGPWARYITAAALFLGFVIQVAAIAGIIGIFTGSFLISVGMANTLEIGPQAAIYVAVIGISALVAFRGLDISVRVAVTLAVLSVPLVVVITVASGVHTGLDLTQQFDFEGFSFNGVFQGVAAGAAFLISFESCAALAKETRDPKRNVPLAIMAVPVVLGLLYLLTTVVQLPGIAAASAELEAGMSPPAALAMQAGLGQTVATASDLVLAVATFASLIAFINYGSRFLATLAADRLLPARVTDVHRGYHTPAVAIGVLSALGFALMTVMVLITGNVVTGYTALATLLVYAWVPAYLLIAAGAIALTIRDRKIRPVLIIASVLGAATMAWLYVNGVINPPTAPYDAMNWVALIAIAALVLVFLLFGRRRSQVSTPREGDRDTTTIAAPKESTP